MQKARFQTCLLSASHNIIIEVISLAIREVKMVAIGMALTVVSYSYI